MIQASSDSCPLALGHLVSQGDLAESLYAHLSLTGCILKNIVTHSLQCPDEEPRERLCDMENGVESFGVVFPKV